MLEHRQQRPKNREKAGRPVWDALFFGWSAHFRTKFQTRPRIQRSESRAISFRKPAERLRNESEEQQNECEMSRL